MILGSVTGSLIGGAGVGGLPQPPPGNLIKPGGHPQLPSANWIRGGLQPLTRGG